MTSSIENAIAPFLDENNLPAAKPEFQFLMGKRKLYQQDSQLAANLFVTDSDMQNKKLKTKESALVFTCSICTKKKTFANKC